MLIAIGTHCTYYNFMDVERHYCEEHLLTVVLSEWRMDKQTVWCDDMAWCPCDLMTI